MISGFAKAALALGEPKYAERARRAAEFVKKHLEDNKTDSNGESTASLFRACYTDDIISGSIVQT